MNLYYQQTSEAFDLNGFAFTIDVRKAIADIIGTIKIRDVAGDLTERFPPLTVSQRQRADLLSYLPKLEG